MRCGYRMSRAASAVRATSGTGSSYVVMKTSTVTPSGGGPGSSRCLARHIVMPNSVTSMNEYVSASTSGTAIHHADQFTDSSHRHTV